MSKYINADKLKRELEVSGIIHYCGTQINELVDRLPSADVKKNTHGEWKTDFGIAFTCSACDRMARKPYDFCPNCGADMKERKETE